MKQKYVAILLGMALTAAALGRCGGTDTGASTEVSETAVSGEDAAAVSGEVDEDSIYGEVSAVGEQSITIQVGTRKEMTKPEGDASGKSEEGAAETAETTAEAVTAEGTTEAETGEGNMEKRARPDNGGEKGEFSMLDLTGEEQEIAITENTVIKRVSMGGGMGGGRRAMSADGTGENGEAPQMPEDGEMPENGEMPQMPEDGEMPENGKRPEMPEGAEMPETSENGEMPQMSEDGQMPQMTEGEEITLQDISEGDIVAVVLDEDGNASEITVMTMGGGMGAGMEQPSGMGGGNQVSAPESYTAVTEYSSDTQVSDESFTSTGTDENAIHVLGGTVTLEDVSVTRTSADSTGGDASSFYGIGAAVLATKGTTVMEDCTVDADAAGGAGVFAYGDGTVYISDSKISTSQDTSGGIHAAGGGTLYAWDLDVETNGTSSAAIHSDRGGGKMVVDEGTYVSNGTDSPAIYSTADIAVHDAELTANKSEAVCIEGLNSLHLYDVELTGNMQDDERNDCTWNVILYQSMSGDSEVGNSTFEMSGGSLTAENGGMFYTTNTESTFTLSEVKLTMVEDDAFFLRCTGNNNQRGWGNTGANGADCLFTAINQEMPGNIIWDSISTLDFYMTDGSRLKGAVVDDETYVGEGGEGYCNLYIDADSTWIVTGDSTVSVLSNEGTIVDEDGETVTIKGSDGTVYVEGSGSYTVTVDSYEESVDISGASSLTQWEAYETQKPE